MKPEGRLRNRDSDRRHSDSPFQNTDSEVAEIDSDLRRADSCVAPAPSRRVWIACRRQPPWPAPETRHLKLPTRRFTPYQVLCASIPMHHAFVYVPGNSKHIISIYLSAIPVPVLSLPNSGSAIPEQTAFAGRPPSAWRSETNQPSLSEMSTQAASLVPCMAGPSQPPGSCG